MQIFLLKELVKQARDRGGINTGMLYIIVIILIILGVAYVATGPTPTQTGVQQGTEVVINNATSEEAKDRLQLYTFGAASITPPADASCKPGGINARPEIIVHVSPEHAKAVASDGRIKLWVNDSKPPLVAPNEKIQRNSGVVMTPGDRAAKAPDGYLLAPALYVFPQNAEAGGQPYFPRSIKGDYNNGDIRLAYGIERTPANIKLQYGYTAQYSWNVSDLGLRAGSYQLQFVVMDGTDKHAVKCITMRVYDKPNARYKIPTN